MGNKTKLLIGLIVIIAIAGITSAAVFAFNLYNSSLEEVKTLPITPAPAPVNNRKTYKFDDAALSTPFQISYPSTWTVTNSDGWDLALKSTETVYVELRDQGENNIEDSLVEWVTEFGAGDDNLPLSLEKSGSVLGNTENRYKVSKITFPDETVQYYAIIDVGNFDSSEVNQAHLAIKSENKEIVLEILNSIEKI